MSMVACNGCGAQLHVSAVSCPHCKTDRGGDIWTQPMRLNPLGQPDRGGGAPARSFTEAIAACISKYATFSGRASRSEYWYFALFSFLVLFCAGLVSEIAYLIVLVGLLLPIYAVSVRRLHDSNRSGWLMLIGLVPILGFITLYWMVKEPVNPNNYDG